jgi:hypothetical protein
LMIFIVRVLLTTPDASQTFLFMHTQIFVPSSNSV